MSDTFVTFQGWVGNDVTHKRVGNANVANFRVASTPRLKRKGDWADGDTTWYTVTAWRLLADNIADSVKKGDAVIVHGRLRSEDWKREDGQISTTLVVDASFVGHDMCKGTSAFLRSARPDRPESDIYDEVAEMIHADAELNTRIDSWGEPVAQPTAYDPGRPDEPAA